jgi:hypothetical protein
LPIGNENAKVIAVVHQGNAMGLFRDLADTAHSQGHKPSQFAVAAQQYADTCIWTLIAAGILWLFTNWKWALILAIPSCWFAFKSISATLIQQHLEKRDTK